ncbi:MAG: hypothetical protein EXR71_14680 [Myxococcales bacterium]|nr:hypothetical protein [Myxococcales bacterium]
MKLSSLALDQLRTLHTALAVPSGPGAPREALRQANIGFHVEERRDDGDEAMPMMAASAPGAGPVIELRFS